MVRKNGVIDKIISLIEKSIEQSKESLMRQAIYLVF